MRLLRIAAIGVVAAVGASVRFFALRPGTPGRPGRPELPPALGKDVASATSEIEYVESRLGRPLLRVLARRNLATVEDLNRLEGVKAFYYGEQTDRQDVIEADECLYAPGAGTIQFKGNVRALATEGYRLTAPVLDYDKAREQISTAEAFTLESSGLSGSGRGFALSLKDRVLTIAQDVRLHHTLEKLSSGQLENSEGPADWEAQSARFQQSDRSVRLRGGVALRTRLSRIDCDEMDVFLTEDKKVRHADCLGAVRMHRVENDREIALAGERVGVDFDPVTSQLSRLEAREGASLQSADGTLTASMIEVFADGQGALDRLLAAGESRLELPAHRAGLAGERFRVFFGPAARLLRLELEEKASLRQRVEKGDFELKADQVQILFQEGAAANSIQQVRASRQGRFLHRGSDGGRLEGEADEMTAFYRPGETTPSHTEGRGACRWLFSREKPREQVEIHSASYRLEFFRGSSDPEEFRAGGGVLVRRELSPADWSECRGDTAEGRFGGASRRELEWVHFRDRVFFRDPARQGRAREAELKDGVLKMWGNATVEAEGTVTSARFLSYDQKSGALDARDEVQTVVTPAAGRTGGPKLPALGSGQVREPVYIHAGLLTAQKTGNQFTYTGKCRMVQGANTLSASRFLWDGLQETFRAEENVRLVYFGADARGKEARVEVRADRMQYRASGGDIQFEGQVAVQSSQGVLRADSLRGRTEKDGGMNRFFAERHVRVEDGLRDATGDAAIMDLKEGRFTLAGTPAVATDRKERRVVRGGQLTFFQSDDRIRVESGKQVLKFE